MEIEFQWEKCLKVNFDGIHGEILAKKIVMKVLKLFQNFMIIIFALHNLFFFLHLTKVFAQNFSNFYRNIKNFSICKIAIFLNKIAETTSFW